MAGGGGDEGFERGGGGGFFHVPQRSRRDKLRINNNPTYNNNNTDQHDHQPTTTTIISAAAAASASPSSSSHHHHHQNHGHLATAIPFYDPSSLLPAAVPTHLLSNQHLGGVVVVGEEDQDDDDHHNNRQSQFGIKEEHHHHNHHQVANLMGFLGGGGFMINTAPSSSSSPSHHHHHPSYLLDPQPSSFTSNLNPNSSLPSSTVHHHINNNNNNNNNPFLYTNNPLHHHHHHHNFSTTRDFDHHHQSSSFNGSGGEVVQQGLSLSLSSSLHTHRNPLELNQQPSPRTSYEHHQQQQQHQSSSLMMMIDNQKSAAAGYASRGGGGIAVVSNNNFTRGTSPHPLGPFTGYALILKESRFLKPAQQLLEEFCAAGGVGKGINYMERRTSTTSTTTTTTPCSSSSNTGGGDATAPSSNLSMDYYSPDHHHLQTMESLNCSDIGMINENTISTTGDPSTTQNPTKKTRLISMLDEVYRRYKQYYQQLLAIIASFETVTGLGNAAPYTTFALKSMSKHFRCLKNAITDQLHFTSKDVGEGSLNRDHEHPKFGTTERHVHSHKPPHKSGILDHQHVWRPQRGLPERAVAVLRAWLFEHFLHPYPTDTDKQMLAKQTGLSRSQVSNWFINARVRLWKPMVEEIHMLETRESQKGSEPADQIDSIKLNEPLPTTNPSFSNEHPQTNLMHKDRDSPQKRIRNEPLHIPGRSNDQMNFSYNNFPSQQHVGPGVGTASGNSGVSLTLGLRQNNGIGLSEPFPMIAHRFGLEGSNEEYGLGSFETTNRHYGKDIGGQLLHDFVG